MEGPLEGGVGFLEAAQLLSLALHLASVFLEVSGDGTEFGAQGGRFGFALVNGIFYLLERAHDKPAHQAEQRRAEHDNQRQHQVLVAGRGWKVGHG